MEKKGIDLNKLKEALDSGKVFEGNDTLYGIIDKSENIDKSLEKNKILEERDERVKLGWETHKDEFLADVEKDNNERMKKREDNEKNEMVFAKIKFLENEIKIYEELSKNIQHELDFNQQKIDHLNAQIEVLKKDIKD